MSSKRVHPIRNSSTVTVIFGIVLHCFLWSGFYYKEHTERQLELENVRDDTDQYARAFEEHKV